MSKEKLGQEPAFPTIWIDDDKKVFKGVDKRFYAACAAMQSLIASVHDPSDKIRNAFDETANEEGIMIEELVAKMAFEYADGLLNQEKDA